VNEARRRDKQGRYLPRKSFPLWAKVTLYLIVCQGAMWSFSLYDLAKNPAWVDDRCLHLDRAVGTTIGGLTPGGFLLWGLAGVDAFMDHMPNPVLWCPKADK
jgi:hypothetical protein